jgi:hypothetical protein
MDVWIVPHYERNPHLRFQQDQRLRHTMYCCLITSVDQGMIEILAEGLRRRYGEITMTNGTTLNYLGMVLDFSNPGETRVSMKDFVEDMLLSSAVTRGAKTPATDGLFK